MIPWGIVATLGDPLLVVAPMMVAAFGILALLGLGAPGLAPATSASESFARVLVPVWSLPPFDAYQDAGTVALLARAPVVVWLARVALLLVRTVVFGTIAHLALQRAWDRVPSVSAALTAVRARIRTLLALELGSWAVFGIPLLLGQGSLLAPGRPVSQLGALVGQMLLLNAFLAAFDVPGPGRALRLGVAWVARRPMGHVGLAVAATAASNAVFWVARAGGGGGGPEALPLAACALAHAVVLTGFLAAFARRYRLLYSPGETAVRGAGAAGDRPPV